MKYFSESSAIIERNKIGTRTVAIVKTEKYFAVAILSSKDTIIGKPRFCRDIVCAATVMAMECKRISDMEARKASKKDTLAEKKASWVNPHKVGDIVYNSWGYEQTNIDFAQVVAVGERSVTIRAICGETVQATGWASARVRPLKDRFAQDSEPHRISFQFSLSYDSTLHAHLPARHGFWSPVGERESFHCSWYA